MSYLADIAKKLDLAPAEKAEVMRELASHYYDIRDELMAAGMSEAQAEEEADKRIGTPEEVSAQLSAVHSSSTLKSALLAAVPFVGAALIMFVRALTSTRVSIALLAVFAAVMLAGSIRELWRGMRPIWLGSWLAASIVAMRTITFLLVWPTGYHEGFNQRGAYFTCIGTTAIVVALAWGRPKWRYTAVVLGLLNALAIAMFPSGHLVHTPRLILLLSASLMIIPKAQLVPLAVSVFYLHQYGNLARALLFLAATSTLTFGVSYQPDYLYVWTTCMLVVAVIIIFFALNSKPVQKTMLILAAVTAYAACNGLYIALLTRTLFLQIGVRCFLLNTIFWTLGGAVVILIPVIYDRLRRGRQRTSELVM